MKAAFYEKTGGHEVIQYGERPTPSPGPGQILVRVEAAGMNPIDTYLRSGAAALSTAFPLIPGFDFAGTVEAISAGVTRFTKGDRVWGSNQSVAGRQGTFAEYAAVDDSLAYPIPDGVAARDAAAVALTGITAWIALVEKAQLRANESLFVAGGSGGVGSLALQMARNIGARIATTAGSAENLKRCQRDGAELAINYREKAGDSLSEALRAFAPQGSNVWFETRRDPDLEAILPLMAKGGRIVLIAGRAARPILPLGSFYTRDISLLGFAMFNASPETQRRAAEQMNAWMAAGKLKPHIGRVLNLSEAAEAHRLQEENTVRGVGTVSGKIIIHISV